MNQYCQYTDNKTATEMVFFGSIEEVNNCLFNQIYSIGIYLNYLNYKNKDNLQQKIKMYILVKINLE